MSPPCCLFSDETNIPEIRVNFAEIVNLFSKGLDFEQL